MNSASCSHVIKLLNLQENVVISYRMLLVKGVVHNFKCFKESDIELVVENVKSLSTGLSKDNGRFKFLVDLGEENKKFELKFSYCKASLIINIVYVKKESIYKIQPLLILAQEEQEQNEKVSTNKQIIDLNLLLVQAVYAEKLKEAVEERLTFAFNDKCKLFTSKLRIEEIHQLNEHDLWLQFAKEILSSDWGHQNHLKFVAFINCCEYQGEEVKKSQDFSYQNIRKHIKGHAAMGAGGLALFSSTYFYSWPSKFENILNCFQNHQNLNVFKEPDDSNYRKTKAGVYASSLGAVCHEIGHIFDLGHDLQGVMGSNFDYINRVFTLETKTEHLPERIVQQKSLQKPRTRFTCLKDPANGFLQRYREQQENDSFYFSPNSAVILSHHPWLSNNVNDYQSKMFNVHYDKSLGIIKSSNISLKLIEVREQANSLVKEWFVLRQSLEEEPIFEFNLKKVKFSLTEDYYLFVMSEHGHTKKIDV